MKTISLERAMEALADMARGEASEPAIITVEGRPVAALVPLDELDQENFILMRNPDFRAMLDRSWRQVQETGGIPLEDVRREFGLPERQPTRRG